MSEVQELGLEQTAKVPIYGGGKPYANKVIAYALINTCDSEKVLAHRWRMDHGGSPITHATVSFMSRLIMSAPMGMVVDHINHDKLDNRRCNLRICTTAQNNMNTSGRDAKSGIRGVYRSNGRSSWWAGIKVRGRAIYLGSFSTIEQARSTRRIAELRYFGEFAPLDSVT